MKTIELRGGRGKGVFALIDNQDFEKLKDEKWYLNDSGYAIRLIKTVNKEGKTVTRSIFMHKEILTSDKEVDHINNNPLDNRRINLRQATAQQNKRNIRKRTGLTSHYKGVCWFKTRNKWLASIKVDRKSIHIGFFNDEHHAGMAYDIWAKDLFGEFAQLNF